MFEDAKLLTDRIAASLDRARSFLMIYFWSVYHNHQEVAVQVAKWGNSLAVRLPQAVVEALKLKEGDEIEITVAGMRRFEVGRDRRREEALQRLRALRRSLPAGFKFDRDEANER